MCLNVMLPDRELHHIEALFVNRDYFYSLMGKIQQLIERSDSYDWRSAQAWKNMVILL